MRLKLLLCLCALALPWTQSALASQIAFADSTWEIEASTYRFESYKGREALYLEDGVAWIKELSFKDGVIEFDIAVPDVWSFHYVMLRALDEENFEEFYLRPAQSNRDDAVQYSPVYNGVSGWQLYHGAGFNSNVGFRMDEWLRVKLVVKGDRLDVYLDSDTPILQARLKREAVAGNIGLRSAFSGARFANFQVRHDDDPPITPFKEEAVSPPQGAILSWQVSNVVQETGLADVLEPALLKKLRWTTRESEQSGIVNLARYAKPESDCGDRQLCGETVLARTRIASENRRLQKLEFGYSDRVRVYVNGRLQYSGNNQFRSRDFRYLGTLGLFDTLYAQLEAGDNEIIFAVSETFGGWGLLARIPGG